MKKRAYNSASRESQSDKTKRRILKTAKKLFESKGFDKTTVADIAEGAKVSSPLIYSLYKSKVGILRNLIDEALPTDDREALVEKTKTEESPEQRLRLAAIIARQIYDAERDQFALFRGAFVLDPIFKKLEIEREKRRFDRIESTTHNLGKEGRLVQGLTEAKARDILWAFTGRDVYRMFVLERGWTSDEYEKWLGDILIQTLLDGLR